MEIVPLRDRIHIREYYPLFARRWPNGQCEFTEYGWHTYPIDPLNGNHIEAYRYAAHNAADAKERTKYELFEAFSGLSLSEEEALAKLSAALEAGFNVNAKDWRGRTLLSWVAWRQWPKAFSQVLQLSTLSEEPQDSLYNDFPSFLRCWSDLRAAVDCQLLPWDQRQVFMTMLLDKALSDGRSNILHNLRYRYIPTAMPDSDWLDRYAAQHPLTPEHLTDLITANAPFFFRISGGLEGKNLKETTAFVVDLTKRGAPRRGIVDWFNFVGQTANAADGLTKDNAWHFDVLFQLIDAGFDPEADADGQSILEAIVQLKFAAPHLQRLVKTYPHLNFDARNIFGYSPLGTIINLSRPRALFDLVIKRTDINVPQGTNGDTYLHLAASQLSGSNDSPYLASILAEKPKMNILNKSGETALDVLTQIIDQKSGSDYHRYCTDDVKLRVRYYHQMARLGARHVKTKPPGAFILNCY